MSLKLNQTKVSDGDDLFFNEGFRNSLEYLLVDLLMSVGNSSIAVTQTDNFQAKYDFYRILAKKAAEIPRCYWWITMRINGYRDPADYMGDRISIIIPDISYLNSLATSYRTTNPVT